MIPLKKQMKFQLCLMVYKDFRKLHSEAYSEPIHASKREIFAKIVAA